MKNFILTTAFIFAFIFSITAQTGNGIVTQASSTTSFMPTTIDSTTTVSIQFHNTVGVTQDVYFSGLSTPYTISNDTLSIPANDSLSLDISFTPTISGSYSDTLDWIGSVFGSGSLVFNGEGVQVILTTSTDSLDMGTISIGTNVTDSFMLSNTGTGTMLISNISSSNAYFSVNPTSASLAQGSNMYVSVTFSPLTTGLSTSTLSIESNDPTNPIDFVTLQGYAVSELSDTLNCNTTWSLVNSPYEFVGDVILPTGCNLTIEPGVVVRGNGYSFYSDGIVNAVGTQTDSIYFNNMAKIEFMNNTSSDNFKYLNINQAGPTLYVDDFDSSPYLNNWNSSSNNLGTNSSYQSPLLSPFSANSNGAEMYSYNNSDAEYISGPFTANSEYFCFSFDYLDYINENNCFVEFYYRINSGSWELLLMDETQSTNWVNEVVCLDEIVAIGDQIEFKVLCNSYNTNSTSNDIKIWFDNFKVNYSKLNLRQENSLNITNSTINTAEISVEYFDNLDITNFEGDGTLPLGFSYSESHNYCQYQISTSYGNPGKGLFLYGYYGDAIIYSKTYTANSSIFNLQLDYRRDYFTNQYDYARFYYRINNGSWVLFEEFTSASSNSWATYNYSFPVNIGDDVDLKFVADYYSGSHTCSFHLDNIIVENSIEYGVNSPLSFNNCVINSALNVDRNLDIDSSTVSAGMFGLYNTKAVTFNNSTFSGDKGISTNGSAANVSMYNSTVQNSSVDGIKTTGSSSLVNLQYSFVKDNGGVGILTTGSGSHVTLSSSMVSANGSYGIQSSGQVNSNYSNISFNEDDGVYLTGNNFSNIKNSIIWGNDVVNYNQINTTSGVTSITYSTVQGSGAYGTTGGQYYFGDGSIDDDPVFADSEQHMSSFSNCVDAGTPWEVDANMPYGLGGVRADIGIYGGPDNWFWGGTPVPDGSPVLTSIADSPQDQGGMAGVLFNASVWDNSSLVNNVSHYSIWRHYDISGVSIDSVSNGNWELIGNMPSQSFNAYAYSASTLGDSNLVSGMFNSCFVVVAHTNDSATFWYSNVMCGYSVDNLAPAAPIASAIAAPNAPDNVIVYWDAPAVPDYASSSVFSNNGFISMGVIDTMTLDVSTLAGGTYTYGVVHYDVNGNASDTAWVTITLDNNEDVIPLTAGWNLISTKQSPSNNTIQDIFSTLMPGNLIYVTGFNQGSVLYNPNGLPFLNTLNQFTDGYGYWVKVLVDDTLRVMGTNIDPLYKIDLMPGWNLSGYMNTQSEAPINYLEDLIISNNLEYCTGFNQGTQLFNPNGLPFLNTLTSMQRPFGYWIKVTNAVSTGQYRLENQQGNKFTPNFMFINGTSNLESHVGGYVEVLNSADELVAKLTILEGGYLMTTALYGDDPHTQMLEGLEDSEQLTFSFNGEKIYSDIKFEGNMELKEINLDFTNDGIWSIYPNPLTTTTTINYELSATSHVSIKVFDVTGREIDQIVNGIQDPSNYTEIWNASKFEKGLYTIELYINGVKSITDRVVVQ